LIGPGLGRARLARLRDACALKSSILARNIHKIGEASAR
jgi:hypothetical protein